MDQQLFAMPAWYWVLGLVVSVYHAARGAWSQWVFSYQQNREAQAQTPRVQHIYSKAEIIFFRCLEDGVFYFVVSAAGFMALFVAYHVLVTTTFQTMSGGAAAIVVFLLLFGVVGISGQLPHLIQQGKFPT